MANQIEVQLSTGKTVWYEGSAEDVGPTRRGELGLVRLKEWGTDHTFYLNPDSIVLLVDHGAPENAGQLAGRTTAHR